MTRPPTTATMVPETVGRHPAPGNPLLERYLRADPRGPHRASVGAGPDDCAPVWAVIGHLRGGGGIAATANAYHLPEDAVTAAVLHYDRNRTAIDAWLLVNAREPVE